VLLRVGSNSAEPLAKMEHHVRGQMNQSLGVITNLQINCKKRGTFIKSEPPDEAPFHTPGMPEVEIPQRLSQLIYCVHVSKGLPRLQNQSGSL